MCARQIRTSETGASEIGPAKIGADENGSRKVGVRQVSPGQPGSGKIGSSQIGSVTCTTDRVALRPEHKHNDSDAGHKDTRDDGGDSSRLASQREQDRDGTDGRHRTDGKDDAARAIELAGHGRHTQHKQRDSRQAARDPRHV